MTINEHLLSQLSLADLEVVKKKCTEMEQYHEGKQEMWKQNHGTLNGDFLRDWQKWRNLFAAADGEILVRINTIVDWSDDNG